jgi:hypothetical protein
MIQLGYSPGLQRQSDAVRGLNSLDVQANEMRF